MSFGLEPREGFHPNSTVDMPLPKFTLKVPHMVKVLQERALYVSKDKPSI